jgi:hypothetical protein
MLAAGHRSTRCTAALPSPVPPAATVSVLRNRALMAEFDWNGTDYQHILTGIEDKVLTITLNRPEARNAWTEIMRNEIIEVSMTRSATRACASSSSPATPTGGPSARGWTSAVCRAVA